MINIAGAKSIEDAEYRYKMPRLVGKIEGRGNGIKTVVVNCSDIASALHRTPAEVCKFFGCELGAQSKFDADTDRAVVNGAFDTNVMQAHLCKYIESFVLCPECHLPETKYKYRKECIYHRCLACGAEVLIDPCHKLTTFILKERAAAKRLKSKEGDKKKKKKDKKEPEEDKKSSSKSKKSKKKKDSAAVDGEASSQLPAEEEAIEWHTDLSEEAVQARMAEAQELEDAARNASKCMEEEEDVVATLENLEIDDRMAIEAATNALKGSLQNGLSCAEEIVAQVQAQQTNSALPKSLRVDLFFHAALDNADTLESGLVTYMAVLEGLVRSNDDQLRLIALVEQLCGQNTSLTAKFPVLLKTLYDEDVLEEEAILQFAEQPAVRAKFTKCPAAQTQVVQTLTPFVEWLKNAAEESD